MDWTNASFIIYSGDPLAVLCLSQNLCSGAILQLILASCNAQPCSLLTSLSFNPQTWGHHNGWHVLSHYTYSDYVTNSQNDVIYLPKWRQIRCTTSYHAARYGNPTTRSPSSDQPQLQACSFSLPNRAVLLSSTWLLFPQALMEHVVVRSETGSHIPVSLSH